MMVAMLRNVIGRIICSYKGHLRGKRVECLENGRVKIFACPRCGRLTRYPIKAAA